ncbi:MAG: hypothetical protein JJW01_02040 [Alphaproteobacteria bacterium]|nr:hypothetical protein [Rickettsiales bacterium]
MNRRTRDEVMPDDERALLQKEMLMISAFLDKTAKVSITRYRKRCPITGWARGLKCGIRRNQFREYASFGQIAGLIKA